MTDNILSDEQKKLLSHPSHTKEVFDPDQFQLLVKKTVEKVQTLRTAHPEIEALAACGHSGTLLMGAVSYLLGMPQIAVRKTADTYHDHRMVNGWMGCKGYLIIDDLVASGATVDKIVGQIEKEARRRHEQLVNAHATDPQYCCKPPPLVLPKPVGLVLYGQCGYNQKLTVVHEGERLDTVMWGLDCRHLEVTSNDVRMTNDAACLISARKQEAAEKPPMSSPEPVVYERKLKFQKTVATAPVSNERMLTQADVAESFETAKAADQIIILDDKPFGPSPWGEGLREGNMQVLWGIPTPRESVIIDDLRGKPTKDPRLKNALPTFEERLKEAASMMATGTALKPGPSPPEDDAECPSPA